MAIGYEKRTSTGKIPVFGSHAETAPGGFLLVTTGLAIGATLAAGTPLVLDYDARTATALHTGIVQTTAGGTATTYQVKKGHTLAVGDNIATGPVGGKAYPITAIDATNADYDVLTVDTTIGAATAGSLLFASTATGATASVLPAVNGLLYEEAIVANKTSVSAVIRGTVYARRVPYSAAIASLAGLKNINYIQSK